MFASKSPYSMGRLFLAHKLLLDKSIKVSLTSDLAEKRIYTFSQTNRYISVTKTTAMIKEIKAFVKSNSYFEENGDESETHVGFTTRENGDVGEEEYSPLDYDEAIKVKKLILEKFKGVEVEIETIDEWVDIVVTIKS